MVFPARHTGLSVVNHTQKRALCLGRRYEKMLLTHFFLFRCVSQPPPLRGTSFHRKEGEPCPCIKAFLHGEGSNARIPLSRTVISSASEKSFSFALKWCMRANGSLILHECGIRCFMQTDEQREQQSRSNKDPSAALGMTVLGERIGSQGWCAAFF